MIYCELHNSVDRITVVKGLAKRIGAHMRIPGKGMTASRILQRGELIDFDLIGKTKEIP